MEKVTSLSVERENVGCFHVRELAGRLSEWQISLTSARDASRSVRVASANCLHGLLYDCCFIRAYNVLLIIIRLA
jgi:hypothetical protein